MNPHNNGTNKNATIKWVTGGKLEQSEKIMHNNILAISLQDVRYSFDMLKYGLEQNFI